MDRKFNNVGINKLTSMSIKQLIKEYKNKYTYCERKFLTHIPENQILQEQEKVSYYKKQRERVFMPLTQNQAIDAFDVDKKWADNKRKECLKDKFKQACYIYDDYENIKTKTEKILFTNKNDNDLEKKIGLILYTDEQLQKCQKKIDKFKKQIRFLDYKPNPNSKYKQFNLEKIKAVNIKQVLENYGVEITQDRIICPFHKDTHPSCYIFKNTNSFYCFSCGAFGSNIDLLMMIEKTDFLGACKILDKF